MNVIGIRDKIGNGYISEKNVFEFLREEKTSVLSPYITKLFQLIEKENVDRVCFVEWVPAICAFCLFTHEQIIKFVFGMIDDDHDEVISKKDIIKFLVKERYGEKVFPFNQVLAIELLDVDRADRIKFEQFKRIEQQIPFLCYPAFRLQETFKERIKGTVFWKMIFNAILQSVFIHYSVLAWFSLLISKNLGRVIILFQRQTIPQIRLFSQIIRVFVKKIMILYLFFQQQQQKEQEREKQKQQEIIDEQVNKKRKIQQAKKEINFQQSIANRKSVQTNLFKPHLLARTRASLQDRTYVFPLPIHERINPHSFKDIGSRRFSDGMLDITFLPPKQSTTSRGREDQEEKFIRNELVSPQEITRLRKSHSRIYIKQSFTSNAMGSEKNDYDYDEINQHDDILFRSPDASRNYQQTPLYNQQYSPRNANDKSINPPSQNPTAKKRKIIPRSLKSTGAPEYREKPKKREQKSPLRNINYNNNNPNQPVL